MRKTLRMLITGKNPGYRVFQAFAARRPDIIGPPPKLYLFAAPFPLLVDILMSKFQ